MHREGLLDPLELDGVDEGVVEVPLSVTLSARSVERGESDRVQVAWMQGKVEQFLPMAWGPP